MKTRKNKNFFESFKHASEGIRTVMKEERNMTYHVSFGLMVVLLGFLLKISVIEWLFLLFAMSSVLVTEIINTSFENVIDLITNHQYHEIAKKVKDMAAGAVLVSAIFAAIIGCLIFLPKLWDLLV
ncbi:MAG: diacylglycerol kinase family protein [Vagococcus sp.]